MTAWRLPATALALAACLAALGWLAWRWQAPEPAKPGSGSSVSSQEARLLEEAGFSDLRGLEPPPLSLLSANGKTVHWADLRGQLVLLHFWGTGCIHCLKEVPALDALQQAHPRQLAVLHVCTDEDDALSAQKTLGRVAPESVSFIESNSLSLARFDVQSLPTVWLIGADGKSIGRASGAKDWRAAEITRLIRHWLPAKSAP